MGRMSDAEKQRIELTPDANGSGSLHQESLQAGITRHDEIRVPVVATVENAACDRALGSDDPFEQSRAFFRYSIIRTAVERLNRMISRNRAEQAFKRCRRQIGVADADDPLALSAEERETIEQRPVRLE